jgi:hypothetical protein
MSRFLATLLLALFAAATVGAGQAGERPSSASAQGPAAVRFGSYDLILDAAAPVGAWQAEIKSPEGSTIKIVGIEGGEAAAFRDPPFYDPAALHENQLRERVILAAYSAAGVIPAGATRIARVHVQVTGADPRFDISGITLGDAEGKPIEGTLRLEPAGEHR